VIQAPHWAFGNGAAPGRIAQLKAAPAADWESTRLKLHAIYRAATGEERLAIAAELGIAGSTLRNIISSSAPGKAVSNRVAQWLVGREGGVRESSAPNSDTGIPISPTPNGADSSHAHYLSADQRERLSFLIASDPTAVRQSGVRISLARHAADGGEIEPATAARLVNFLSA
jgi:hypothetical protein